MVSDFFERKLEVCLIFQKFNFANRSINKIERNEKRKFNSIQFKFNKKTFASVER